MYVHVHSGLMSRCVTLAHAYYLIKQGYDDKLVIVWPRDDDCAIAYADVFDKAQFEDIDVRVIDYVKSNGGGIKKNLRAGKICKTVKIAAQKIIHRMPRALRRKREKFMQTNTFMSFDPPKEIGYGGEAYHEYTKQIGKQIRALLGEHKEIYIYAYCGIIQDESKEEITFDCIRFRKCYVERAKEIVRAGLPWVGIHIRRTDHKPATEKSTMEIFLQNIKEILAEHPDTMFFLATDDKSVEEKLRDYFPGKIRTQSGKAWGRDSKSGMVSGIVDCLCLSECELILGSYMSVFTNFSALYGKKKLRICGE